MDAPEPFPRLRPPKAPKALKERVLRAAGEVPVSATEPLGIIDRIWESRAWRWAWVGAVAALLCAHVVLLGAESRPPVAADDGGRSPFVLMILGPGPDLADPTFAVTWVDRGRPTLREIAQDPAQGS
jgi:hypothetical protein